MPAEKACGAVCGVILAGGKSLRMGRDKALLALHGQSLLERAAAELSSMTDEIIISANDPAPYQSLGFPVIPDAYHSQGPLAGLHAAMAFTTRPLVLVLACDLPRIRSRHLIRMLDLSAGFDAVIPRTSDDRVHPLCALYRHTCLRFIEASLARQENKMIAFLDDPSLRVLWLSPEEGSFTDADLVNLNSPNDLEDYLASTP